MLLGTGDRKLEANKAMFVYQMLSRSFQYEPSLCLFFFVSPPTPGPLPRLCCYATPPPMLVSAVLLLGLAVGKAATLGVAARDREGGTGILALSSTLGDEGSEHSESFGHGLSAPDKPS